MDSDWEIEHLCAFSGRREKHSVETWDYAMDLAFLYARVCGEVVKVRKVRNG